jgi:NADP-dependent 3-hydroxy acid dehydrogenase YdfG
MLLKDKIAIVTGSSDGLGRQIALRLASEGVCLALVSRSLDKLADVQKEALELGSPRVEIYQCDLRNKENVVDTVGRIVGDFGSVQILINNAGIWQKKGPLDEASLEDIENVIDTNLTGLIMMTHQVLPVLRRESEAAIINVSSRSGVEAKAGQSIYCASKWGVRGFTESLRVDLEGSGIRVAGIYQGRTATRLFEKARDNVDLSVAIRPEDLANAIVFILSSPPQMWLYDVRVEY